MVEQGSLPIDYSSLSRRQLGKEVFAIGAIVTGAALFPHLPRSIKDRLNSENAHYVDREYLNKNDRLLEPSDPLYRWIYAPIHREPVDSRREELDATSSVIYRGNFTVRREDVPVSLTIQHDKAEDVLLHPLMVTIHRPDTDLHLYLPLVSSYQTTRVTSQLGEYSDGEYEYEIRELESMPAVDRSKLSSPVFSIRRGNSIQEKLWRKSVLYGIRPNNLDGVTNYITNEPPYRKIKRWLRKDNLQMPNNDAPLLAYSSFYTDGKTLRKEDHVILSSEDNGKTAEERVTGYGRTPDEEISIDDRMEFDAESVWVLDQRPGHRYALNRSKKMSEHRLLQIRTDNNNFDDMMETNLYFFPEETYIAGEVTAAMIIQANPAIQVIGYDEESRTPYPMGLMNGDKLADKLRSEMKSAYLSSYPNFSFR